MYIYTYTYFTYQNYSNTDMNKHVTTNIKINHKIDHQDH